MRNLLKITVAILLLATAGITNAQVCKSGHIDMQALVQVMPERTTAEEEYSKFQSELEELLGAMQKEYQTMIEEFQNLPEETSELVKNAKLQDIQDKDQRIQTFSANAQQQLQQKQAEVLGPVLEKARGAIDEVAKELGLVYVFDVSSQMGVIVYKSNDSKDLLPLVKTKLGITQ